MADTWHARPPDTLYRNSLECRWKLTVEYRPKTEML